VREPYRYEREVEEFLRWSPYVRRGREEGERPPMPNVSQLTELQKFLSAYSGIEEREPAAGKRGSRPRREPEPEPERESETIPITPAPAPVDDYDALEAEEVISLLGSLERDDLLALRAHEASAQGRELVLRAIDGVLKRREPAGTR